MNDTSWTIDELICVCIARQVQDGEAVVQGLATPLVAAGYLLAGPEYFNLLLPAGLAITLLCSAFYMVGRALDEIVNPRLRDR